MMRQLRGTIEGAGTGYWEFNKAAQSQEGQKNTRPWRIPRQELLLCPI